MSRLDAYFTAHPRATLGTVAVALAVIGIADYLTGIEVAFSIFYLVPVATAAWYVHRNAGIAASLIAATAWFANEYAFGGHQYTTLWTPLWNTVVRLGYYVTVTVILAQLNHWLREAWRRNDELAQACVALDNMRKEQLLYKDQLLSHVSHELRTPLTAAHGFTTLLLDGVGGEIATEQREYLDIVLRNLNQLNRMIGDLLDSTRIEAGKLSFRPARQNLAAILEETCRSLYSFYAQREVRLLVEPDAELPPVLADADRVRQVLLNLLDNALKFTPAGGSVRVTARSDGDGRFVRVAVTDTGRGIAPDDQKRLFNRLQQVSVDDAQTRKGLGLGLYISREIVGRHGGTMSVSSKLGHGATFEFTVPVDAEQPAPSRAANG